MTSIALEREWQAAATGRSLPPTTSRRRRDPHGLGMSPNELLDLVGMTEPQAQQFVAAARDLDVRTKARFILAMSNALVPRFGKPLRTKRFENALARAPAIARAPGPVPALKLPRLAGNVNYRPLPQQPPEPPPPAPAETDADETRPSADVINLAEMRRRAFAHFVCTGGERLW